jgi:hypothetical protein
MTRAQLLVNLVEAFPWMKIEMIHKMIDRWVRHGTVKVID